MNRSPLFFQSLNRLIGRTMRQAQLNKGASPMVRHNLKWAVRWLNLARKAAHNGSMFYAWLHIESAMREIKWARQSLTLNHA